MVILGIDPWTTTTGFAFIKKEKHSYQLLDYGVLLTTPKIDIEYKILEIWTDIAELIKKFQPEQLIIEKLFFQNNIKTAIDVAQARWVVLYEAMRGNLDIYEYTPLQVKKAVTWHGKANKIQLQNAIKILFWMDEVPKPDDAADAIWLAYMGYLNSNSIQ
jgi:crossover junction endodeoxyribonuclease RuvC